MEGPERRRKLVVTLVISDRDVGVMYFNPAYPSDTYQVLAQFPVVLWISSSVPEGMVRRITAEVDGAERSRRLITVLRYWAAKTSTGNARIMTSDSRSAGTALDR